MSKMSQLHAELTQQAAELGFMSIEEAEANGYEVDYGKQELVPTDTESELNEAHKAWLKERDDVLEEQAQLHERLTVLGYDALAESVYRAIKFIREQCHD